MLLLWDDEARVLVPMEDASGSRSPPTLQDKGPFSGTPEFSGGNIDQTYTASLQTQVRANGGSCGSYKHKIKGLRGGSISKVFSLEALGFEFNTQHM